jgi:hypothetical protein
MMSIGMMIAMEVLMYDDDDRNIDDDDNDSNIDDDDNDNSDDDRFR